MKILHVFSDWKWTGPAEPALEMVRGLQLAGVDVHFAITPLPFSAVDTVRSKALKADLSLVEQFSLRKHFHPWHNFWDVIKLTQFLREQKFDLVHAHRHQDHLVAGLAACRAGLPLVRSSHQGVPLPNDFRNRLCFKHLTNLCLSVSRQATQTDQNTFQLSNAQISYLPPAVDTEYFCPQEASTDLREQLKIPKDKVIVGIVARMQRHRRFQELLESWARVSQKNDQVHFVIIGRGTHMEEVAVQPANKLGLQSQITFAGYHRETYLDALRLLDIKIFLVPGSDGSCRALRQALSLGIPVIGARRGMIPEIILDNENGLLIDDTPENLSQAILKLIESPSLRKAMGQKARQLSIEQFSLKIQTQKLIEHYERLIR